MNKDEFIFNLILKAPFIIIFIIIVIYKIYKISISKIEEITVSIENSQEEISINLLNKYNYITKIIDIINKNIKYEYEPLFDVKMIRYTKTINEIISLNNILNDNLKYIDILIQNNSVIKNEINELKKKIIQVEKQLQASKRLYNSYITSYNKLLATFPNNIIAKIKKNYKKEYFIS